MKQRSHRLLEQLLKSVKAVVPPPEDGIDKSGIRVVALMGAASSPV